ncbi:DUF29 domain-containing protein [Chroococcidiopsis sp. CCMEE 29]|uniref:DUF29 domain-containing protein n=1 Tax=Chroococcidiopsis sp. CCMEE 29 TaxID=155894 RepID=UPI0020215987|nr:DUF29 domain-containing protein [Chroococcidiopsis sp. CCMEE 29]
MKSLYKTDFYAWTQQQIHLLKQQAWQSLDVQNLLEELADLGRRERQELRNRLSVLLGHLLKWQFQPQQRGNSWLATIREQREQLVLLLDENPSLKPYLSEALSIAYKLGLNLAVRETDLPYETFPSDCPYSLEATLDDAFLPDSWLESDA